MVFCTFSYFRLVTDYTFRSKLIRSYNLSSLPVIRQLHSGRNVRTGGAGTHNLIFVGNESATLKPNCFKQRFPITSINYINVSLPKVNLDPVQVQHHCQSVRPICCGNALGVNKSVLDVNTKVVKDVILFRYENPKYYKMLNAFAFCQFFFWIYLSHFAYSTLKDAPVDKDNVENLPWWRKINLGENKYRNGITLLCFVIGYGILAAAWAFTLKSVRFLVLRKGGESVTFVTYGPFGKNRMTTVPISQVSCEESRQAARVQLPMKAKNNYLYYVLDMRGEFTNPRLFDHTVGVKRVWKS